MNSLVESVLKAIRDNSLSEYGLGISVHGHRRFFVNGLPSSEDEAKETERFTIQFGLLFKPILAAIAVRLSDVGMLDLEAPIASYLPELADDHKVQSIRIRHLMSQSSGYSAFNETSLARGFQDRATGMSAIGRAQQLFFPGTVYNYDHSSTALLIAIVEGVSGVSLVELAQQLIFSPLGIASVRWRARLSHAAQVSEIEHPHGKNLFDATVSIADLLTLTEMFIGDSLGKHDVTFISSPALEVLRAQAIAIPRFAGSVSSRLLPIGHGLGFYLYRGGFYGYDTRTAAQTTGIRCNSRGNVAFTLTASASERNQHRSCMAAILELFEDIPCSADDTQSGSHRSDNFETQQIVGDYYGNQSFDVSIRRHRSELFLRTNNPRARQVQQFGIVDDRGRIRFSSNALGMDPTFFYYSRTGETCLMWGMFAFLRLPTAIVRG